MLCICIKSARKHADLGKKQEKARLRDRGRTYSVSHALHSFLRDEFRLSKTR